MRSVSHLLGREDLSAFRLIAVLIVTVWEG
jgi:hypothetical protein